MTVKITVNDVYKIFGAHPEKAMEMLRAGHGKDEILKKTKQGVGIAGVSFDVREGEILVVMGLSGSGKSTLVRCINRLIEPTAGSIVVDDVDVTTLDTEELRVFRQRHFGMVFQNFALFPHRTVLENVEYGLEVQHVDATTRRKASVKALEQVGLEGWGESYPAQLSGGMQQRVGLARALALDPDIMLMDEAFSALDPLIRRDMQSELLSLQETMQKTIVFISHDLDEALKIGDRIILMKDGVIVQEGTAEQILMNPANDYVAKFVEDVNISKVLTASSVMRKPEEVAILGHDGPRAALRKMKRVGISTIFVVRRNGSLEGIISAADAVDAIKRNEDDIVTFLNRDIHAVSPDTPASELFSVLAEMSFPVAVVNEANILKGIIVKSALLAGLAEGVTNGND